MTTLAIHKVSSLPTTLTPSALYFVSDGVNPSLLTIHVADSTGTATRHVLTKQEVDTAISDAIAAANSMIRVANIAARNALSPTSNILVLVTDATADPGVASGAAVYFWDGSMWTKISEFESLDVIQTWASLQNKPTSSVADIDLAVTRMHVHTNSAVLAALTDSSGILNYNGAPVGVVYSSEEW